MAEQTRVQKPVVTEKDAQDMAAADTEVQESRAKAVQKKGEEIMSDLDELLDEIDAVLEVNAEEFVKSYVQKGGE